MKGFGELLFGKLQLLSGQFELGDVTHYHQHGRYRAMLERLGGHEP